MAFLTASFYNTGGASVAITAKAYVALVRVNGVLRAGPSQVVVDLLKSTVVTAIGSVHLMKGWLNESTVLSCLLVKASSLSKLRTVYAWQI